MAKHSHRIAAIALFGLASVIAAPMLTRADDKKPDEKKKSEEPKPALDPKDVRVGPPPELAELRKVVEDAAKKGENVDEIRKQLDALEKALAGKAWVKPKPVEEPPAPIRPMPFPNPVPFGNVVPVPAFQLQVDPKLQEAMQKAQEMMLRAAVLRAEDPAKADELMKQARELLKLVPGGLVLPPAINMRAIPIQRAAAGGRLGIRVEKVPAAVAHQIDLPGGGGILAAEIVPGSAADKAGIQLNDIILEFAGKPVGNDPTEFVRTVHGMKAGEKVDIVYLRKGKKAEAKAIPLADLPEGRFNLEPAPVPVPMVPFTPRAVFRADPVNSTSVSVQVQGGKFTIEAIENSVKFKMEGTIGDTNKAVPTKIEITDGRKNVEAASVEKLPEEYRGRVQKILDSVKVGK